MNVPAPKPVIVPITDEAEIASIERNGHGDIIGGKLAGVYWAYKDSYDDWRERQRVSFTDTGGSP